jgi:NhaP-type Na+/H+ or K+/H+ antiporter
VEATAVLVVAAAVFLWGAVSARLERADLTAPIVFTVVGAALAGLHLVHQAEAPDALRPLVEITLVWVLFADAARVRVHDLRVDVGRILRLLVLGLPLTILAGWGLAAWLFPAIGVWLALLIGAALAPTDAALGVPVVTNRAVPSRVRRLITVESGLNDGIATPVVMVAIAGAASTSGSDQSGSAGGALLELAIGVVVGVVVGVVGGRLLRWTRGRGWAAEDFTGVAVLALALAAYLAALALDGNGFVAAFCGGLAFGAAVGRRGPAELVFLEQTSGAVSLLVWLAFGAIAVPIVFDELSWQLLLYAVLSLTLVRMVPVALALVGTGTDRDTVLFIGWFGPRGLASLLFALLALEGVGSAADEVVAVIAVTVFLSVLAHGISAAPLATRFGRISARHGPEQGGAVPDVPVRSLPRAPHVPVAETAAVSTPGTVPPRERGADDG